MRVALFAFVFFAVARALPGLTAYVSYTGPNCTGEPTMVQTLANQEFGKCGECIDFRTDGRRLKVFCDPNPAEVIPPGFAIMYTYSGASSPGECTTTRISSFAAAKPGVCVTEGKAGGLSTLRSYLFNCDTHTVTRGGTNCKFGTLFKFSGSGCQDVPNLGRDWAELDCSLKGGKNSAASRGGNVGLLMAVAVMYILFRR